MGWSGASLEKQFDVVIIGAGSAGCVLANRLTSDPQRRVLLLEAGGWDWNPLISVPIGARMLFKYGAYQWGDVAEPDPGLSERRLGVPHGKIIGGTSSINYMAHIRGHPADFDRWAAQGATGWSYREVLPYFKECETWERGENVWRGGRGELGSQEARVADPLYGAWFEVIRSLGYEITSDFNGEKPEGFGVAQYSVRDGRRSSSACAFLHPALGRRNLNVRTRATAIRLLFQGRRAIGVEYASRGRCLKAYAAERTVLCLGSINTPHLLMLSGVGPADHLRDIGIMPIIDLPVGRNLEDHLAFEMHWTRPQPGPFHRALRLDRVALSMVRAYMLGSGPATRLPGAIMGFIKSQAGAIQPDLQLLLLMVPSTADFWFPGIKRPYVDGAAIRVQLLGQQSRGEIWLRSADPKRRPLIHYHSLSAPQDLQILRHGFNQAWAISNAPQLSDFRRALVQPQRELKSEAEIDCFIRASAMPQYHPACTCRMGNGDNAVVDPQLNVRGIDGLSVVDASVMPSLVSANPNVTIMMMAAKAAHMLGTASQVKAHENR
jgi:choline dehydrogenase-like flavoprotein